jgi:hypothetical protein
VDICWIAVCNVYVRHPVVFIKQNNSKSVLNTNTFVLFTDLSLTLREELNLRVFENRVLRRLFGAKREVLTGEWRKLHNEKRDDPGCSPSTVGVIKSRIMEWEGHVARMVERRGVIRVWWGNRRERDHLIYRSVDEKVILRSYFRKWDVMVWSGLIWLRIERVGGHL